jgi:hypothetical protein
MRSRPWFFRIHPEARAAAQFAIEGIHGSCEKAKWEICTTYYKRPMRLTNDQPRANPKISRVELPLPLRISSFARLGFARQL